MIKPKYISKTEQDVFLENGTFKANGCMSWFLFNGGNTNVTIGVSHVLKPGEGFGFENSNPEIADYSELTILFDQANDPITVAPGAGAVPGPFVYTFGVDPVPAKNNKLVVYRSNLSEA